MSRPSNDFAALHSLTESVLEAGVVPRDTHRSHLIEHCRDLVDLHRGRELV